MMRDSVKEFIDKEVIPKKPQFEKKDYALTEDVMRKAGELGLLGIAVPEEYDGMGMDFVTTMLVCDYISGATGSIATAFGAHTGIGRSEEHTSELQSRGHLVCRLLLEKKK